VLRMYFELLTEIPMDEVEQLLAGHLKTAKVNLAKTVIAQYYDSAQANEAADRWQNEIGGGGLPADIPEATLDPAELQDGSLPAFKLLTALSLCSSGGEARRLIAQGGAKLGPEKTVIESIDQAITVEDGLLVWAGKKKFCRVKLA
ncbi:MAG: tyrosine--tRNA ligase, partial [Planctomycetaceae bacterium]|nr:tyrosine--tRNA ligase [Planctomycetaceae bacterium]